MINQARELNAESELAQAEAKLNDILETLKLIQNEINERKQRGNSLTRLHKFSLNLDTTPM